jgi:uncharacterized membrane-anchored protein YitT (DUF2179 family)
MSTRTTKQPLFSFSDFIFIGLGILSVCFALNGFLVPNKFIDGGMTGLSLLISESYPIPLSWLFVLTNIPFIIMAAFQINRRFAIKMLFCIVLLAICLALLHFPVVTKDKLIVAVFGGFFLGLGAGLAMRVDGVFDGIEVLALYTGKRLPFKITEIILAINVVMFLSVAYKFGLESCLY